MRKAPVPNKLSSRLFYGRSFDCPFDMYSFDDMDVYRYFIDHVPTLAMLREGLHQLSPYADDALRRASRMSEAEFTEFMAAVVHERHIVALGHGDTKMKTEDGCLLLPNRFMDAILLANTAGCPLGAALIRLYELGQ